MIYTFRWICHNSMTENVNETVLRDVCVCELAHSVCTVGWLCCAQQHCDCDNMSSKPFISQIFHRVYAFTQSGIVVVGLWSCSFQKRHTVWISFNNKCTFLYISRTFFFLTNSCDDRSLSRYDKSYFYLRQIKKVFWVLTFFWIFHLYNNSHDIS